jgi:sugar/nucleoside kinase (ribokinase family)
MDCVAFTLIIDDIVFPDGTSSMAQLGGGGPQTLWGFQTINMIMDKGRANLGLSAGVGSDLPSSAVAWLESINCSTIGLKQHPTRGTPRAWQVFEYDGKRTQIWRVTDDEELIDMLRPASFKSLPEQLRTSHSYHIGVHPQHPPVELLKELRRAARAKGGLLSVEPYTSTERPLNPKEINALIQHCDVFSPNQLEAESILGYSGSHDMLDLLFSHTDSDGPEVIVIRRGELGVLSSSRASSHKEYLVLPAVEDVNVVDVTGCGNSFCGGFLASYTNSRSLMDACAWGSVAASFMAEEQGVPRTRIEDLRERAIARWESLSKRSSVVTRSMNNARVRGTIPHALMRRGAAIRAFKT